MRITLDAVPWQSDQFKQLRDPVVAIPARIGTGDVERSAMALPIRMRGLSDA